MGASNKLRNKSTSRGAMEELLRDVDRSLGLGDALRIEPGLAL